MPRTKIVCTIGPSSRSADVIRGLIRNGMNVARLNFSHGTHAEHGETIETIRTVAREENEPVGILQDLCGPKIRVGKVPDPGVRLAPGQPFVLTTEAVTGSEDRVGVTYADLPRDAKTGDRLLLADGLLYVVDADGFLRLVEPSPDVYKELASVQLLGGHEIWAPLALSDGKLVIRDQKQMLCLDVRNP